MHQGILTKQELNALISAAAQEAEVYVPVKGRNGVEYLKTSGAEPVAFDYVNVKLSPKGLFFPQKEVICRFCRDTLSEVPAPEEKLIVFGARPCDARSLLYLDQVFADQTSKFADPYYLSRRNNALMMTFACHTPAPTCFCTTVGGSPTETTGSDILVTELGDELLFEACSEKASAFLETYQAFFRPPTGEHLRSRDAQTAQAAQQLNKFNIDGIKAKLDRMFEEQVWETLTNTCLGCGVCTYLCPTCHCFDISDETNAQGEGVRLRTWDSCQYPLFTMHASGHNPRVNKKQRMRQRIMHKFSYTVENVGDIYCVGCGRCVIHCPVNLDIREMLQALAATGTEHFA